MATHLIEIGKEMELTPHFSQHGAPILIPIRFPADSSPSCCIWMEMLSDIVHNKRGIFV